MKTLIIGFGSIGKRHAEILSKNKNISEIKIFTNQIKIPFNKINKKNEILEYNPDYIIISNSTHLHFNFLKFLEKNFSNKDILVEKPLFNKFINFNIKNNRVFVGYNLRFHPLIRIIKDVTKKHKIWSVLVTCGSYLPHWRKHRHYKLSYSAQRNSGGVLLDLSHELDYVKSIVGNIKPLYAINKKISDLNIKSDDFLNFTATTYKKVIIQINLSYFFKKEIRQILIDGKDLSITADLILNNLYIYTKGRYKKYSLKNYNINKMYIEQHNEIINNKTNYICSYKEAKEVMKIIEEIKKL